ncbi:MAG: MFS transporter [Thermoleophilaceae bacterium]|nr:MFS transporter [Thermoleophilaceae bacterium]
MGRLARVERYPLFYVTATVTRLADEMFSVGAVLLVLERTGSAVVAGLVVAATALPSLVTGPLLGAWLDISGKRRRLMLLDQVLVVIMLVTLVLAAGNVPDWTLPLVALIAGVTWPLSFGGFSSLVPILVPGELLPEANSMEAASYDIAIIGGPALAGTLVALFSPEVSLITQAGISLVGFGLIASIPALDRTADSGRALRETVVGGLRALFFTPQLRSATAIGTLSLAGLGLLTVAFPFFAIESLGENRGVAGYLWAAFSTGSIIGSIGLVSLLHRFRPERIMLVATGLSGVAMLLWPLASVLPLALAFIAVSGLCDGPGLAATFSTRQQYTPRELYGQVSTTGVAFKVSAFAMGAAVAGPVVVALGPEGAIWVCAGMQFLAVGVGALLARDFSARRAAAA